MKKTVIIGATTSPDKYANICASQLTGYGHPIVPMGIVEGTVEGEAIINIGEKRQVSEVDTVTMYIAPWRQPPIYEYLLSLNPKRIIFNPGTENEELAEKARAQGIEALDACTLVMLSTGQY